MSELKAILATLHPKMKNACDGAIEVYPKSEADKEIQRLEKLCENYRCDCDNLAFMTDITRKAGSTLRQKMNHQKYKRCLAKAEMCHWKMGVFIYKKEKSDFYYRWHRRWLELAEKFKPNKEAK